MKHHILDLPGNNREMIRNAQPEIGLALFALSTVKYVPLERVNPSPDSNRCRFDYVSILVDTACVRRGSRVSRHPYTLLPPSHSTDHLATRADDHDDNHTPWIVISISIVCTIGMTLHLNFVILLASVGLIYIISAASRDLTKIKRRIDEPRSYLCSCQACQVI